MAQGNLGAVHRVTASGYNFEPHIAVDPTDPQHLAAMAIKMSKFDGYFRPRGECEFNLYLHESWDGGESWSELRLTESMGFDPQVVFSPDGALYSTGLDDSRVFVREGGTESGVTAGNRRLVQPDRGNDKPWLSIDAENGAMHLVYSGRRRGHERAYPLVMHASYDSGASWSEPVVVEEGPVIFEGGEQIATGPWGGQALYGGRQEMAVTWMHAPGIRLDRDLEGRVWFATSGDGGRSFSAAKLLAHSRGAPSSLCFVGEYYVFYTAGDLGRQKLVVSVSEDGGSSWSEYVVCDDLYSVLTPTPGVGVAPDGALDVVFYSATEPGCYDLRARARARDSGGPWVDACSYNVYYTCSHNGGRTWTEPLMLNEQLILGKEFARNKGISRPGEYIGMASASDRAYPIWIEGVHAYTRCVLR